MQKLVFSYVHVEGWVIDQDVHSLLDGFSDAMCLPAYYGDTAHTDRMSLGLAVLIDGGGGNEVFFELIPKGPSQFPNTPHFPLGCLCTCRLPHFFEQLIPCP